MKIGLFPLSIVLFPGARYPLYIFEGRYRSLVHESRAHDRTFGINLVEEGHMFQVGCLARVAEVTTTYDDGSMDIIVEGTSRFQIKAYGPGDRPYLTADVNPLPDVAPTPDYQLLERTIGMYNELVESVYGEAEEPLEPSAWLDGGASFRIAQKAGLELATRQHVLEMRSETGRLEFLSNYLDELLPKVKELEKIQMLIRNDGYVK